MNELVVGCLLGSAVGDALGLPMEGLSRGRALKLFPGPLRHRFFFGRGMVSDDTEHTLMVLRALRESEGDVDRFRRLFARSLRVWLLMVPAGAGLATVRACLRLLVGIPPSRSGVVSAGNGAAMRSAIIGAWFADQRDRLDTFAVAAAEVTHRDPRAIEGALAIARAAAASAHGEDPVSAARSALAHPAGAAGTAQSAHANRVSGYVVATVLAALDCLERHPQDYREAVRMAISKGGDTDTLAAIVGGVVGARVGEAGIPREWLEGLAEWPRTVAWMRTPAKDPIVFVPIRNAFFLLVVLGHGLRRLLPPY
jgi:ADP-ribosylglycohydrolase